MHPVLLGLLVASPLLVIAAISKKRHERNLASEEEESSAHVPEESYGTGNPDASGTPSASPDSGSSAGTGDGIPASTPNDRFFEQLDEGSEVIPFVRAYGQNDKYMIQSILDAHGIPSFLSSQYVNNLLPGVRVKNHTDSIISIDAKDRVEASILVLEYIESLSSERIPEERSVAKSLYNAVALLHAVPAGDSYRPELLIDIDELAAELEEKAGS